MKRFAAIGAALLVVSFGCDGESTVEPTTASHKLWCQGQAVDPELLRQLPPSARDQYIKAHGCVWGESSPSPPVSSDTGTEANQPANPAAQDYANSDPWFPIGDFCARLDALAGGAIGVDACADAFTQDVKFNRAAMDAYYDCIRGAESWDQAVVCQDQQRNGKSPSFAFEFDVGDQAALGEVAPLTVVQIHGPWVHTVVFRGELLMAVTASETTERTEVVATCLPRDGWEARAANLTQPTKVSWLLGTVVGQTKASQGNVPAIGGCYWAN